MERVAGSDCRKGSFLGKQLIGKKRVLNKNKWKLVVFQNIFSLLISKSNPFLFYSHTVVSFELELTSYISSCAIRLLATMFQHKNCMRVTLQSK
jgi:hypothetical protein